MLLTGDSLQCFFYRQMMEFWGQQHSLRCELNYMSDYRQFQAA